LKKVAAETGGGLDPIEQFDISRIVPLHFGGHDISFTNSALFMLLAVGITAFIMISGSAARAHVPGRMQSLAETAYEFVANMVRQAAGESGMKFFPLVFCLFMFIFVCNFLGLIPYTFTVTTHIIITVTLALMVFFTVIITGFVKNGFGFLRLFVPSGVPWWILPFVVPIEIISFLSRPVSHSIRLFANMLAGHITLNVFGGFVVMLLGAGAWAALAPLPFAFTIGLMALEMLVAFLQAYVFAMLTCMYINDALHPGH
jgi:F-type H+-transporting ATPase subunit a